MLGYGPKSSLNLTAAFTYGQEGRGDFAPYGWT